MYSVFCLCVPGQRGGEIRVRRRGNIGWQVPCHARLPTRIPVALERGLAWAWAVGSTGRARDPDGQTIPAIGCPLLFTGRGPHRFRARSTEAAHLSPRGQRIPDGRRNGGGDAAGWLRFDAGGPDLFRLLAAGCAVGEARNAGRGRRLRWELAFLGWRAWVCGGGGCGCVESCGGCQVLHPGAAGGWRESITADLREAEELQSYLGSRASLLSSFRGPSRFLPSPVIVYTVHGSVDEAAATGSVA